MLAVSLGAALAGCASAPTQDRADSAVDAAPAVDPPLPPDAVPRIEPRSKYGNPPSYVVFGRRYFVREHSEGYVERGIASWYGQKFHGRRTSSGETYDMHAMTAAHKSLPLPTYVRVTNLANGRAVVLKVNDRGPFRAERVIDLSYAAARKLGMVRAGTALVEVRAIDPQHASPVASAPMPGHARDAQLYVQVGAFASLRNAEQLRTRIARHQMGKVEIHEAQGNERTVYRVRIGPMSTVERADRTVANLQRMGMLDYRIVVD